MKGSGAKGEVKGDGRVPPTTIWDQSMLALAKLLLRAGLGMTRDAPPDVRPCPHWLPLTLSPSRAGERERT